MSECVSYHNFNSNKNTAWIHILCIFIWAVDLKYSHQLTSYLRKDFIQVKQTSCFLLFYYYKVWNSLTQGRLVFLVYRLSQPKDHAHSCPYSLKYFTDFWLWGNTLWCPQPIPNSPPPRDIVCWRYFLVDWFYFVGVWLSARKLQIEPLLNSILPSPSFLTISHYWPFLPLIPFLLLHHHPTNTHYVHYLLIRSVTIPKFQYPN